MAFVGDVASGQVGVDEVSPLNVVVVADIIGTLRNRSHRKLSAGCTLFRQAGGSELVVT